MQISGLLPLSPENLTNKIQDGFQKLFNVINITGQKPADLKSLLAKYKFENNIDRKANKFKNKLAESKASIETLLNQQKKLLKINSILLSSGSQPPVTTDATKQTEPSTAEATKQTNQQEELNDISNLIEEIEKASREISALEQSVVTRRTEITNTYYFKRNETEKNEFLKQNLKLMIPLCQDIKTLKEKKLALEETKAKLKAFLKNESTK